MPVRGRSMKTKPWPVRGNGDNEVKKGKDELG